MYKSKLQELCQQKQWGLPKYSCIKDGPDHSPKFIASVHINGASFDSATGANSSKEAQNSAAEVAFLHFTSPVLESAKAEAIPIIGESENEKTDSENHLNSVHVSNDMQHQYKSQLQNYAQFYDLPLPVYSVYSEGRPHGRYSRATVTVNGVDFKSPSFFKDVKEAENAAAKAALMSLAPNGIEKASSGYYKSQLQELVQKEGFSLPSYKTSKSGALHVEMFYSTVEVEGQTFQGKAARSKKQAEINAAMVACIAFENSKLKRSGQSKQPASSKVEAFESQASLHLLNPDNSLKKTDTVSSLVSSATKSQQQVEETHCPTKEGQASSPTEACSKLSALSIADSKTDTKTSKCKSYLLGNRVRVYPRIPDITFPEGITVLPISDDAWVAVSLEFPNETSA